MSEPIKVRFPPSPTGFCHVGTARMAVLNYMFAKKNGGMIVFRSEDTDRERSKVEFEEDIKEQLTWLGVHWDVFERQSERLSYHTAALARLIGEDKAYVSAEPSKNDPNVLVNVVRLRNPGTVITFTDMIRGDITFDTTELKDFVIARSTTDPLYHFAVVMDDHDMGITHVIRGEDHISNTPRQILIQEALGFSRPFYAHYPLHLGADKSKLSKRTGDVAVKSYREKGFLPEALLNYIAHLGWTPPSEREIMSLDEMIAEFDIKDLHKSGAVFDMEKLRWYNREYLLRLSDGDFRAGVFNTLKAALEAKGLRWDESMGEKLLPIIKERISVWSDISEQVTEGEYDYFFVDPEPSAELIPQKGDDKAVTLKHLSHVYEVLHTTDEESFASPERLKEMLWDYATAEGRGSVLWPLRYSLSGRSKSPDPFSIASIVGKSVTLKRIESARSKLA
ncbi:MAG: glutamate--tRNA ligase [Candidatus Pacebacteria bacterium]|nr:glutamate--tRNA ligase [Candidatus Paceibacterota bacterium]